MTTMITYKPAPCGARNIRIKRFNSGYTIKCVNPKRKTPYTILVRPLREESIQRDLLTFCENCSFVPEVNEKGEKHG